MHRFPMMSASVSHARLSRADKQGRRRLDCILFFLCSRDLKVEMAERDRKCGVLLFPVLCSLFRFFRIVQKRNLPESLTSAY